MVKVTQECDLVIMIHVSFPRPLVGCLPRRPCFVPCFFSKPLLSWNGILVEESVKETNTQIATKYIYVQ